MTEEEMTQMNQVLVKFEVVSKQLGEYEEIIKLCYPIIKREWEKSGVGYGGFYQRIMLRIQGAMPGVDRLLK